MPGWIRFTAPALTHALSYLAGEQARLQGGVPLRRFLRGATIAYRRFLLTTDPAHRFHCWATIHAASAGLERLERRDASHKISGSAPSKADPGRPSVAGLADRAP